MTLPKKEIAKPRQIKVEVEPTNSRCRFFGGRMSPPPFLWSGSFFQMIFMRELRVDYCTREPQKGRSGRQRPSLDFFERCCRSGRCCARRCREGADPRGKFLGVAHYSSTSQITLRLLSDKAETIDRDFFRRRLTAALEHRERVVQDSDAYRLVFSEGDLLPGLIVDRYGSYLVLQTLNQGMDRARDVIVRMPERAAGAGGDSGAQRCCCPQTGRAAAGSRALGG